MIAALGIVSGCLTTLSWVPQLLRTWRSGHADDMFTFATGVAGWIVYGVLKHDVAVIFANVLTFILLVGLVWMKHGRMIAPRDHSAVEPPAC